MDKKNIIFAANNYKIEYNALFDRYVISSSGDNNSWVSLSETSFRIFLTMTSFGKPFEKVNVKQGSSEICIAKYPKGTRIEFTGKNAGSNVYINKDALTIIAGQVNDLLEKIQIYQNEEDGFKSLLRYEGEEKVSSSPPASSSPASSSSQVKRKFENLSKDDEEKEGGSMCCKKKTTNDG